ncbi:hypothetical protein Tco_0045199 [Tanacetum coccineum]
MRTEMLLAKENNKAIRTCLKYNNQPLEEKGIAVLLVVESILTVMQTLEEKQIDTEKQDSSQYWKYPVYNFDDDDDDFYRDEHLDTILEMDSDDEIESSVENLNLTPSGSEDLSDYVSECDLPFCDNSPDFNNDYEICLILSSILLLIIPLVMTTSLLRVRCLVRNFKFTRNPLLEFDEEIFSSKINPLYNEVLEDLDSIPPRDDHFNVESDLIESFFNKDTMITFPKIDFLLEEFVKELNSKNDFEKENSGSTTIHTDISLPEYESFDNESGFCI